MNLKNIFVLILLLACLLSFSVFADDELFDGGGTPDNPATDPQDDNPCENECGCSEGGDPVYMRTGEFELSVTDVYLPGRSLSVEIVRTYGSRREYNSTFGYGWDINYNLKLKRVKGSDDVMLLNGKGCRFQYTQSTVDTTKYIRANNLSNYLKDNGDDTFTLHTGSLKYHFNENDALSAIENEQGNTIEFYYVQDSGGNYDILLPVYGPSEYFVAESLGGPADGRSIVSMAYKIEMIKDDMGRIIHFFYNTEGLLEKIQYEGKEWEYTYDSQTNDLLEVLGPSMEVDGTPTRPQTHYLYDEEGKIDAALDPRQQHNLTTIYDTKNRVAVVNYYDDEDWVWKQTVGNGSHEFTYDPENSTSVIKDRKGYYTEMQYNTAGQLVSRDIYETYPGGTYYRTQYTYNSHLDRERVLYPKGNCVDYAYDYSIEGQSRLMGIYAKSDTTYPNQRVTGVLATTYTYDTTFQDKIKTITDPEGNVATYTYDAEGRIEKLEYPSADVAIGPVGYWMMDDDVTTGSYSVKDFSGKTNDGQPASNMTAVTGQIDKALSFNGSSEKVTCDDSRSLHTPIGLSVSAWINPSSATQGWIVGKHSGSDYGWYLQGSTSQISATIYNDQSQACTVSASYTATGWHHIGLVVDTVSEVAQLYIDGSAAGSSQTFTGTIRPNSEDLTLGGKSGFTYYTGLLDEVMVFDQALTSTEIGKLQSQTYVGGYVVGPRSPEITYEYYDVPSNEIIDGRIKSVQSNSSLEVLYEYYERDPLVGHWRLDEDDDTSTMVLDTSHNAMDGTAQRTTDLMHVDGVATGAFLLNGSDYITIADASATSALSQVGISCFFKTDMTGEGVLLAKDDRSSQREWSLSMNSGKLYFYVFSGSNYLGRYTDLTYNDSEWHHVAASWDGTTADSSGVTIYVDGQEVATTDNSSGTFSAIADSSASVTIGADSSSNNKFSGSLDEVILFDEALPLNAAEVLNHDHYRPSFVGKLKRITLDPASATNPLGYDISTEYEYDSVGHVSEITNDAGDASKFFYDHDLLKQTISAWGHLAEFSYDEQKMISKIEVQLDDWDTSPNYTLEYTYNVYKKLQTMTDSLGHVFRFDYDNNENLEKITDPIGYAAATPYWTEYQYNERNLLTDVYAAYDGTNDSGHTVMTYDDNGNLDTITDDNSNVTDYDFDDYDRLDTIEYPDTTTEDFSYDNNSNLTSIVTRDSKTITFIYDDLDRLIEKHWPSDEKVVKYYYDLTGRLAYVEDESDVSIYRYDMMGQVSETVDTQQRTIAYEHDQMGKRQDLVYSDGTYLSYDYDAQNRLTDIYYNGDTDPMAHYSYDELSRRTKIEYDYDQDGSFDAETQYDYEDKVPAEDDNLGNNLEKLTNIVDSATTSFFEYTYDAVGNRRTLTVDTSGDNYKYNYDLTYQLESVEFPENTTINEYVYADNLGNRSSSDTGFDDMNYGPVNSLNQYSYVDKQNDDYYYDNNGNTIDDSTYEYDYDYENHLISVDSGTTASYAYDHAGRRIQKTVGSTVTQYAYDGPHVIAEYEDTGGGFVLVRKFIYGPGIDEPICMITVNASGTETGRYFYQFDGLGSVIALVDASDSSIEATYSYDDDAFGVATVTGTEHGNPYRFTARRYDSETGLYYYRARYYKPEIGRFLQTDPLGYYDSMNLYIYCFNNSVNWIDPFGLNALARRAAENYFNKWYEKQKSIIEKEGKWWEDLTKCPPKIPMKDGKPCNPDKDKFKDPKKPSGPELALHPGAAFSMRSNTVNNHSNQCIYDKNGNLFYNQPTAGTVDYRPPSKKNTKHYNHDVRPVYVAAYLDYGIDMGVHKGTKVPLPNKKPISGGYLEKYYEMRPLWAEPKPKVSPESPGPSKHNPCCD